MSPSAAGSVVASETVCRRLRPTLPICAAAAVDIAPEERQRLSDIAAKLLRQEPLLASTVAFGPRVRAGIGAGPAVFFEDGSEIALARHSNSAHEYRSLLLAGTGDLVIVGGAREPAFEDYCARQLNLGRPSVIRAAPVVRGRPQPLAVRCRRDRPLLGRIVRAARRGGELSLITYMATGGVWRLAGRIAEESGVDVHVAGPPPRLCRRVNDKIWFARRVREVLGRDALPLSYASFGPVALAARLAALAKHFERLVIKVPSSAGSAGTIVLRASELRGRKLVDIRDRLVDALTARGWSGTYPLMIGVWEYPVIDAPSVQLWIPPPDQGLPLVEGVFSQIVEGDIAAFGGAVPSSLPGAQRQRLADEATRLGFVFQRLGYFGRCSLDAVLVGDDLSGAELHWVECNGRWGGVSIPMTLLNRLLNCRRDVEYVILQDAPVLAHPMPFHAVHAALRSQLLKPGKRAAGVVLLSPGPTSRGTGLHFAAIDHDQTSAQHTARLAMSAFTVT